VQAWEWNEIHGNLAKITVQLPGEAQASRHAAHCRAHQVVQIAVSRSCKLEGPEANIVEGLVVKQEAFVRILHELVKAEDRIVRFHDCVRDLGAGDDRERLHDAIWVFLAHL